MHCFLEEWERRLDDIPSREVRGKCVGARRQRVKSRIMRTVHAALIALLCVAMPLPASTLAAESAAPGAPPRATPAPRDVGFPGLIEIDVDLTDLDQRVIRTTQRIPCTGGSITLLYPRWLPGNHAPTGPIESLAGLVIHAQDVRGERKRLAWRRHPLNSYAFEIDAPAGTIALEVALQFATALTAEQGRRVITPELLGLQWEKSLLYPAGHYVSRIRVRPVIRLRPGWTYASALREVDRVTVAPAEPATGAALHSLASTLTHERVQFADVTLERLVDSPLFAGRHVRRIELDGNARGPAYLTAFADRPALLETQPAQVEAHLRLVREAVTLFGSRHYSRYEFLLALSEHFDGIGLEHHESSENAIGPGYFVDWNATAEVRDLLPHELVHSWVGKFRRPADLWTPDFNEPMQNSLLWVYEGLTEYWSAVLAARSGLWSEAFAREALAWVAAVYGEQRPGRAWRNLQDTTNQPIMAYRQPRAHPTWQRGTDYYSEGTLLWLDVDAQLRALTGGRRSLDDFAVRFFGIRDGELGPLLFRFGDLVATLNEIAPHDWQSFLRSRLDANDGAVASPAAGADWPLSGLARAGWRLVYSDVPSPYVASRERRFRSLDYTFSLGIAVARDGGRLTEVVWGSPAFRAGLSAGAQLVAVNGRAFDEERLRAAIVAAAQPGASGSIDLLVRVLDDYRTVRVDYRGGLRHPHLERIPGSVNRLAAVLRPRAGAGR
jgi:predicted metalloprotease with PDZ domain